MASDLSAGKTVDDAVAPTPVEIEWWLRVEWFMHHGHSFHAHYIDDGEMQCSECVPFGGYDYKRMPIGELKAMVDRVKGERLRLAFEKFSAEWHERNDDDHAETLDYRD